MVTNQFVKAFNEVLDDVTNTDWSRHSNSTYTLPYGRAYVSGWSPRAPHTDFVARSTIHDIGAGTARSVTYQPINAFGAEQNTYDAIRARCLASNNLWEDPDFPAEKDSLFYRKPPSAWPNIVWKRPKDICSNPQLFVGGASRMDVVQGILGDCWLLAALSCLTTNETLMAKVIPPGQSFQKDYAGIFRFQFWQYGRWVEVLIDDRLPTKNNQLIYMHSDERNEFWSALVEKAYAKLNGSYEALSGGLISESLTDLTGGLVMRFELNKNAPDNLLDIMLKSHSKGSLMGCSIDVTSGGRMEQQLPNGLLVGHAYSVTDIRSVRVKTIRASGEVLLIRVRNPWGDEHEWNGAWSDRSPEWRAVSEEDKRSMGLTFDHDGEFWMSFKDFSDNFQRLEICLLGPDSLMPGEELMKMKERWAGCLFEGSWRRRVNAGGCRNYLSTFWTNPQYQVHIAQADSDNKNGNGTIIVELMQKDRRKLRRDGKTELTIGYAIYKASTSASGTLDQRFFQTHAASAKSSAFSNLREVCEHHELTPGDYVIIPSTFEPNEEGDFILRIYSERKTDNAKELDDTTGQVEIKTDRDDGRVKKPEDKAHEDAGRQAFLRVAGSDREVDAFELQEILNSTFKKEFRFDGFSIDMTRSMVAMCDTDLTGKLNYDEYLKLWTDLTLCKHAFKTLDTNNDGYFNSYEFRHALNVLGMRVSNATFNAIAMRYSDKDGHVLFNDFVAAYIKLKMLFALYKNKDPSSTGRARFSVEEFTMYTMYS